MITEDEWDRMFLTMAPVAFGAASVVLGIMTLTRASSPGRRAYHLDGQYLVSVRYPGQWHDIREFVQPGHPDVLAIYSQFGSDYWSLYDFVCRNIDYRRDVGEFWQFPSETLRGYGDCEDSSILLTSLLRCFTNAYTVLGSYQGWGHAWVASEEGKTLEATYAEARHVPDPEDYCPYVCFNDQEVVELWPGALDEVFSLQRNEATKLNLMAEVLQGASSNPGDYRYAGLPEACVCESCGYELINPGTHCRAISCPVCGGVMWRKK